MYKKTSLFGAVVCLLLSFQAFGQKAIKKAEILSLTGNYTEAIASLQTHLEKERGDIEALMLLGNLQYQTGDLINASNAYRDVLESGYSSAELFKNYGNVSKQMGDFNNATTQYMLLGQYDSDLSNHYLQSLNFAKSALGNLPVNPVLDLPVNTSSSDFGLTFYKGLPVFTSFRNDILISDKDKPFNKNTDGYKTFIFNEKSNRNGFLKGPNNKIVNFGPIQFTDDARTCIFFESNLKENLNVADPNINSVLFIGKLNKQGELVSAIPFDFNEVGSTINSACLAFNGNSIYFSSNREGGQGGFDVYVSHKVNEQWTIPHNLGATVNTPGNEVTPYFDNENLFFASDYLYGLGGYDIFKTSVDLGYWSEPQNMSTGINSIADDIFPTVKNDELYFSSNRLGSRGGFDVFKSAIPANQMLAMIHNEKPDAFDLSTLDEKNAVTIPSENSVLVSLKTNTPNNNAPKEEAPSKFSELFTSDGVSGVSMDGAVRISIDRILNVNDEVFFIQLASLSSTKPNYTPFKALTKYGNIYRMNLQKNIKIKLGYYTTREEAEHILQLVKADGHRGAFITTESLATTPLELIMTSLDSDAYTDNGNLHTTNPEVIKNFKVPGKYKIRLASYEDPRWFDIDKVKEIGRIEQWTKGDWTIFVLAGYNSYEEAQAALVKANNKGFKTAEVVIDNGGVLERIKQN